MGTQGFCSAPLVQLELRTRRQFLGLLLGFERTSLQIGPLLEQLGDRSDPTAGTQDQEDDEGDRSTHAHEGTTPGPLRPRWLGSDRGLGDQRRAIQIGLQVAPHALQAGPQHDGIGDPLASDLGRRIPQHRLQRRRNPRQIRECDGLVGVLPGAVRLGLGCTGSDQRVVTQQQLGERQAQRVHVVRLVGRHPVETLGRQVRRRVREGALVDRQPAVARERRARRVEVEDPDRHQRVGHEHQVLGLQVAVHVAGFVHVVERVAGVPHPLEHLGDVDGLGHHAAQRATLDELEHHDVRAVLGVPEPVDVAHDRRDRSQRFEHLALAVEPVDQAGAVGTPRFGEDLQRDDLAGLLVVGAGDDGHAAFADEAVDDVVPIVLAGRHAHFEKIAYRGVKGLTRAEP